ncbi:porin [Sphingomonas sp. G124]|uniref:Porin n=1 Tax=Sphingomonas cremea TaxID=2904799 RepID=A0A9X1QMY7_9SPHN|nr:porin [Sphingomonas cremea]MCF2514848.1 porin [Sphingomonas cremea]
MRLLLLAGGSFLALSSPAFAQGQSEEPPAETTTDSPIDSVVDADATPAVEAATPTGDPILDRLNALEARVRQLEARNAELEQQAELNEGRLETVETRAAKAAQFSWTPTISDPSGNFSFRPRGVVEADVAAFIERKGGYDYNNGTAFRRARIGFEGTAYKYFNYRVEMDFAGNAVNLTDAYLQYSKIPKTLLTFGQHKAPFGLESNNSDNFNMFLERGMFTNAFGNVGAERRIGLSAAYAPKENLNLAIGLFGDNESISRSNSTPVTDTPDESWGFNGRATWEPIFDTGKIVHLGLSGYYRMALKSGDTQDAVRLSDRPNVRVDNGNIADSGVITGVRSLSYGGAEAAVVLGPFTAAGEVGRIWLDRPDLSNKSFTGFYSYVAYMLTGETRPFRGGNFDRVRPFKELGKDGLGAFELALRYDSLDLSNTPVAARAGNEAETITLGLNWYFNPYAKLMFNWIHFRGDNTPLDPDGSKTEGDAFATRLHYDF